MNTIKMPKLASVKCVNCGATDSAYWGEFGAEQPCLNCDSAPVFLARI